MFLQFKLQPRTIACVYWAQLRSRLGGNFILLHFAGIWRIGNLCRLRLHSKSHKAIVSVIIVSRTNPQSHTCAYSSPSQRLSSFTLLAWCHSAIVISIPSHGLIFYPADAPPFCPTFSEPLKQKRGNAFVFFLFFATPGRVASDGYVRSYTSDVSRKRRNILGGGMCGGPGWAGKSAVVSATRQRI